MAGSRRRAPGKTWPASHSVEYYDTAGKKLAPDEGDAAVRVRVRWRQGGKDRKRVFTGSGCCIEAARLSSLLQAAYEHDWPADERGYPMPQVAATPPFSAPDAPALPALLSGGTGKSALTLPKVVSDDNLIGDVDQLAKWFRARMRTRVKKNGGTPLSGKTLADYEGAVGFVVDSLRYAAGDPRLEGAGRRPGDSMLLDPVVGVRQEDLLAALDLRAATNLRTRAANERTVAKYQRAVAREVKRAQKEGGAPSLPPAPRLEAERATARTIEAFAGVARKMLTEAFAYGRIGYQPWTNYVEEYVPHPHFPVYSTKSVATPADLWSLVEGLRKLRRMSTDERGAPVEVTGELYAAMVALAGREGPRPEETIAIRHSWLDLDGKRPRIILEYAEVTQSKKITGAETSRMVVTLKHRAPGEQRVVYLDDPRVVEILRWHVERFVPKPDPGSDDPERRDPRVFTTHRGAPIDLGNFKEHWWGPVVAATFAGAEPHLENLQFRHLRAAAITSWLVDGWSLNACALKAGNTQGVIEKHYAGVLAEIGYEGGAGPAAGPPIGVGSLDLAALDDAALAVHAAQVRDERTRRAEADFTV